MFLSVPSSRFSIHRWQNLMITIVFCRRWSRNSASWTGLYQASILVPCFRHVHSTTGLCRIGKLHFSKITTSVSARLIPATRGKGSIATSLLRATFPSLIIWPIATTLVRPECGSSPGGWIPQVRPYHISPASASLVCLWGDVLSLSWLCSYTSRWIVQRLATCLMTASLSQMTAAVGFFHLMFPPVWSRALTQALVTGPSKSLDPDSGTVSRLHCVSPTRRSASSRNCWRLICLAETAAH